MAQIKDPRVSALLDYVWAEQNKLKYDELRGS